MDPGGGRVFPCVWLLTISISVRPNDRRYKYLVGGDHLSWCARIAISKLIASFFFEVNYLGSLMNFLPKGNLLIINYKLVVNEKSTQIER